ncbi:MAG TPA: sigma 54-interacting transcriptional regulator [Pyrinomonadaceae bacterium]|nr:sigma 54-interacting transcriptional regulator [Pyrinomonadaceae bacterium]
MRVLYVEDDARDADLTVRGLEKSAPHFQIETVSTIKQAHERLERLDSEPLELVLVDMYLPDGTGLDLLNHIRENRLPLAVVMVTGTGDEDTAVAALKVRADDYVVKRKNYIDRLPIVLERALNHYRASAARQANPLRILLAADDASQVENTRRHLAVHADHIQMDSVSNGPTVLQAVTQATSPYDVVVLDSHVPELHVFDVMRELRFVHKKNLPVILICQQGEEELCRQGLTLGASSYILNSPGYLYQLPWEIEQAHSRAELMRREAALRESESRLRLAQQAARVGTWEWDLRTNSSVWSEMIWKLLGLEPNDEPVTLDRFIDFIHPEDRERALRKVNDVIAGGSDEYYDEFRIVRLDGRVLWLSSKGGVIRSPDGRPERMLGANIDITERKLTEESLKTALAEVRQLKDQLHAENVYLQEEIRVASNFDEIIGRSNVLNKVLTQAEQVAPTHTTVLILGETGTGKELLAHAIHKRSPRHKRPLVKINCAALPAPLIESELFGHEKGAFTGAGARRPGRFEIADGGTIFLDEVGELPLDLQSKLLRVLEEGEFEQVGSSRTINVDVRVIAATNRNLAEAVHEGSFRSDLYYRLNVFPITVPPLRERREDIPMLVNHLVKHMTAKLGKSIEAVPKDVMTSLTNYSWPGNIRELRNVIERAAIITQGPKLMLIDRLEGSMFETEYQRGDSDASEALEGEPDSETLAQSEYNLILRTLKKVHWRIEGPTGAAELLRVHPSTLRSRMKKLGISRPRIENAAGAH